MDYLDLFSHEIAGNTVRNWFIALGLLFVVFLVLRIAQVMLVRTLKRTAVLDRHGPVGTLAYLLERAPAWAFVAISAYVAVRFVQVPGIIRDMVHAVALTVVVSQVIWVAGKVIDSVLAKKILHMSGDGAEQLQNVLRPITSLLLWSVAVLLILSNMGVNVTSLVASLGIGGIAVALAVQNVLGDMFDCFAIYLDRPFRVGDFIVVGDHMGVVKRIGLKSTRIESIGGEELVIANRELTSTRVRNFKRMQRRRVEFGFGLTYSTPPEIIEKIPLMIERAVKAVRQTTFDRAHFKSFGDSSLDFTVVYYVETNDYKAYMDIQQAINLALVRDLATLGADFAFPTRTVHLEPVPLAEQKNENGTSAK